MDILKNRLIKYFATHNNKINIKKLVSIFKVSEQEYPIFASAIYELEKEGKILGDNDGYYIHKPEEFYLLEGIVQKSVKNGFYLNLGNGTIITIPTNNLNGAKENDIVFVSVKKGEKHNKQKIGNIVRIVTPPIMNESSTFYKGVIKKNYSKNFCYIEIDSNIIYIPDKALNGAYPNDLVSVQIIDNKYGKVIDILKRNTYQHVLEYKSINGKLRFVPIGTSDFEFNLILDKQENFEIGDRILVNLSLDNEATYIKKIENTNDFDSYVKALLYDFGFTCDFLSASKEEVRNINTKILKKDYDERIDLRNLITFTIDGETAKDLDDAVSLEITEDGYCLYVHIADVSHYVKEGMVLFDEAYKRGTSVYPGNCVLPMLPKELSNGVCSLNPNEDKLTKTCKIEFDFEGNLLDYSVFNSIINSNYKMSYDKVNDILQKKEVDENYKPYVEILNHMNNLSNLLQTKKLERGFLCFETDTKQFSINETGDVECVCNHHRGPAELIIENFMLKTNEIITSIGYYYQIPFMYRNHEGPTVDQINKLKNNLGNFRKFVSSIKNVKNSKVLQKILMSMCKNQNSLESMYFSKMILKCMNRAFYNVDNVGHYALALEYYGTFTSPIRRFPDLLNHIIIDKVIRGDLKNIESYYKKFDDMCEHCNETQINADMFEKHIDEILLKDYISKYIGKELDAKIVFISHQVVCIRTVNDIYGYMELPKSCFSDNKLVMNGMTYSKGDKVTVTLDGIKQNSDEILFSIIENKKVLSKKRKKEIK